jgi:hypothetical protein
LKDDLLMSSLDGRAQGDLKVKSQVTSSMLLGAATSSAKELIQDLLHCQSGGLLRHPAMASSVSACRAFRPGMTPQLIVVGSF